MFFSHFLSSIFCVRLSTSVVGHRNARRQKDEIIWKWVLMIILFIVNCFYFKMVSCASWSLTIISHIYGFNFAIIHRRIILNVLYKLSMYVFSTVACLIPFFVKLSEACLMIEMKLYSILSKQGEIWKINKVKI